MNQNSTIRPGTPVKQLVGVAGDVAVGIGDDEDVAVRVAAMALLEEFKQAEQECQQLRPLG